MKFFLLNKFHLVFFIFIISVYYFKIRTNLKFTLTDLTKTSIYHFSFKPNAIPIKLIEEPFNKFIGNKSFSKTKISKKKKINEINKFGWQPELFFNKFLKLF